MAQRAPSRQPAGRRNEGVWRPSTNAAASGYPLDRTRVRIKGRKATRTRSTKAAEAWTRAQETAFDEGKFLAPQLGSDPILSDVVDDSIKHRKRIARPPGATFANTLARLKDKHGLEPLGNLTVAFWRKYSLDRVAQGVTGSTVAGDLAYASSVGNGVGATIGSAGYPRHVRCAVRGASA